MAIPELQDTSGRLTDCIYFGDPISSNIGSGFVPTARTISTTAPLTGGGDLSANRTFAIDEFAGSTPGSVPNSPGGDDNFLRADGTWAVPGVFTDIADGYAPASGGGAVNYLRADGTWAAPAGSTISGLTVGFIPVADSATSIVDGRIEQIAGGLRFYTTYTDANDYRSLHLDYDSGLGVCILKPFDYNPPTIFATPLKLTGQSSFSSIEIGGLGITMVGGIANPTTTITVANGHNVNVDLTGAGAGYSATVKMVGPTLPFSIGGFGFGSLGGLDGQIITVHNSTDQPWTIVNEDALSFAQDRIITNTDANVVLPANTSTATFMYVNADDRWVLVSTNPAAQYPRTLGYLPYQDSAANLADSTLFHDSANNRYGFATATPLATVDINGTLATRSYNQALSNGLNSNLAAPTTSYMRITGPTGSFSVGGVAIVTGENGKRLTIHNTTAQAMTIVHEDASSTAANRINTLTAANIVFPARQSVIHLVYSTTTSRWILDEANPVTAGGATTQVQHNLAGALSGDTGLVVAGTGTAKTLTLGTDVTFARKDTRHLELGTPNAAPSGYILAGNSAIGGTDSNKVGGAIRVGGGAGTGDGHGGDTILSTAYQGAFGNTQNSATDRLVYNAHIVEMTNSTAGPCFNIGVPRETGSGGTFWYTVYATDGTDMQIRRGRVEWAAVNKAAVITVVLGTPEEVDCTPVGTLTVTVTATDLADDTFDLEITPISSLTTTTFEAWGALAHDGKGAITPY